MNWLSCVHFIHFLDEEKQCIQIESVNTSNN